MITGPCELQYTHRIKRIFLKCWCKHDIKLVEEIINIQYVNDPCLTNSMLLNDQTSNIHVLVAKVRLYRQVCGADNCKHIKHPGHGIS